MGLIILIFFLLYTHLMLTGEKYILVNNCIFKNQRAISVEYCPLIFKLIISCFRFWCLFYLIKEILVAVKSQEMVPRIVIKKLMRFTQLESKYQTYRFQKLLINPHPSLSILFILIRY